MPGSNLAYLSNVRAQRARPNLESEVLGSLNEAVIATDLDGYIIFWNRGAERLYGWTADEVHGRNILDVTPTSQTRAAAVEIFEKLVKGESWAGEFETKHKDGRGLSVEISDYPVRDQQGKLTAIVGISKPATTSHSPTPSKTLSFIDSIRLNLTSLVQGEINESRPLWRRFAIAFLLYGLAVSARLPLESIMPGRVPFLTFFPAIIIAAFICGSVPTFFLAFGFAITGAFFWAGLPEDGTEWTYRAFLAGLFLVVCAMMVIPIQYAMMVHRRLKLEEGKITLLNRELKHRIKNLFAITSSICLQTIKAGGSPDAMATAIAGRIQSVSSAQDLITDPNLEGTSLQKLIDVVVRPLCPDVSRIATEGSEVFLPSETIVPFALVLHELATNAVKYGAWASERGKVFLEWRLSNGNPLAFVWREEATMAASPGQHEGFGSVIIKRALSQAKVRHEIGANGVMCLIELPL